MLPSFNMPFKMWMSSGDCNIIHADDTGIKIKYNNSVQRIKNDLHVLSKDIIYNDTLALLDEWSMAND